MINENVRLGIYTLCTALLAVAAVYGFVNEEQVGAWAAVAGAATNLLASFNVKKDEDG